MKRTTLVFLFVPLILGCSPPNTPISISTIPVDTPAPVLTNTISPSPTSSLEEIKCEDVKTGTLDELNSSGTIVFHDMYYKAYMVNLNSLEKVEINNEDGVIISIAVSPNQKWTAYYLYGDNPKLVILNSSGLPQIILPWEEDWNSISSWLDNQRLLINIHVELSEDPAAKEFSTFLVFNPFTRERELLVPDFPEIYSHNMFSFWDEFGSTVHNSSLDRVVYIKGGYLSNDGYYRYALWSIDESRELADFKIFVGYEDIPKWSPDEENFAIPLNHFDDDPYNWPSYDLYIVNRNGEIENLVDLSNYFAFSYIDQHSWSPDGKYIAFWFSGWMEKPDPDSLNVASNLAIVGVESKEFYTYCLSGKPDRHGITPAPVWSPDGSQILVESPLSNEHSEVLLLDLDKEVIVKVGEDMIPVGWMIEP